MRKWMLAASAAAIAFAVPTLADPGGNKGKGGGDRPAKAMKADRGGGGGDREVRRERRSGGEMRVAQRDERGNRGQKARGGEDDDRQQRVRGNRGDDDRDVRRRVVARDRDDDGGRRVIRDRGGDDDDGRRVVIRDRDDDDRRVRLRDRDDDDDRRIRFRDGDRRLVIFDDDDDDRRRGWIDGCPPGLAKKGNGCLPPGQAKKLVGSSLPLALRASMLDGPYRQWYRDDDRFTYRRDDDYIYRVRRDGGLIDALFPSYDRDYYYYPVGMNYPLDYNYYNVPYQYRSFYPDGGDSWYRYGDGAIYQVNPQTSMIQSIVALLAGDLAVGQRLPMDYGVYNVPLSYRDRYYDTPDDWYRYNDGYIYRVDPTTQMITAVIQALV